MSPELKGIRYVSNAFCDRQQMWRCSNQAFGRAVQAWQVDGEFAVHCKIAEEAKHEIFLF